MTNKSLQAPWYDWASEQRERISKADLSFRNVLQTAIVLADEGFQLLTSVRARRSELAGAPSITPEDRNEMRRKVQVAAGKRDAAIKVALAQGISYLFANGGQTWTETEARQIMWRKRKVPPGLALAHPNEHLAVPGNWVERILGSLQVTKDIAASSMDQAKLEWPLIWNTCIAWRSLLPLMAQGSWSNDLIEKKLLLDPLPKVFVRRRNEPSLIPTRLSDDNRGPGLKVRLHCSAWLARVLRNLPGNDSIDGFTSLDFDTRRLGDKGSNDRDAVKTGLDTKHLHFAVLIEHMYQLILNASINNPSALESKGSSMVSNTSVDSSLPKEDHPVRKQVSPMEWIAADVATRAMSQAIEKDRLNKPLGLETRRSKSSSPNLADINLEDESRSNLAGDSSKSPSASEASAFALQASALNFQPPKDSDERDGFGSVTLDPDELDSDGDLQWITMVLVIHHKGNWFVMRPDLLDDAEDECRVHMALYDDLAPELLEVASMTTITSAMARSHWAVYIDGSSGVVCGALDLSL